jgi:hypothetical protein
MRTKIEEARYYAVYSMLMSFFLIHPNTILITLFSNALRLYSFLKARYQVPDPYKTTGSNIVLHISKCTFLYRRREDRLF